jgi:hypothetical protein
MNRPQQRVFAREFEKNGGSMRDEQYSREGNPRLIRFEKISIVLIALFAAGLAYLYEGQPGGVANSKPVSLSLPQERGVKMDLIRTSARKAPAYCPVSGEHAGGGSKKSFCDMLWRNESLLNFIEGNEILSWTSKALEKGASALRPAIQFVAGHCLSFLKL